MKALAIIRNHEWSWKEGWKVYCQCCGAEYRDSTKKRHHRSGCEFARLIKLLEDGQQVTGDSEI